MSKFSLPWKYSQMRRMYGLFTYKKKVSSLPHVYHDIQRGNGGFLETKMLQLRRSAAKTFGKWFRTKNIRGVMVTLLF